MSYWGLNLRWLLGRGRLHLRLLHGRHGGLLLREQLLLVLLVQALHQWLLRAPLGHHRELGSRWLLGCWVYCLKLLSLGLLLWLLLVKRARGLLRRGWGLRLWLRLLLEEELLLVLGGGLGLGGQPLSWSGRWLLCGGWSLWLLRLGLW